MCYGVKSHCCLLMSPRRGICSVSQLLSPSHQVAKQPVTCICPPTAPYCTLLIFHFCISIFILILTLLFRGIFAFFSPLQLLFTVYSFLYCILSCTVFSCTALLSAISHDAPDLPDPPDPYPNCVIRISLCSSEHMWQ